VAETGVFRRFGRIWRCSACWVMLCALTLSAHAGKAGGADLDEHVNRLTSELRCLVCQNQTVADSHSELALQLKNEVRLQLSQGASDEQVRQFMVERYGDVVLYRPPVNASTWLLWGGPALLLLMGAVLVALHWRDRRAAFKDAPDSVLPQEEPAP